MPSEKKTAETHVIDPKYLLNDQQMCDYITQGFLVLKTDLPSSVHEQIYRRTSKVMEKEGNPGNNILPPLVAACEDAAEERRGYAAFALGEMGAHVGAEAAATSPDWRPIRPSSYGATRPTRWRR